MGEWGSRVAGGLDAAYSGLRVLSPGALLGWVRRPQFFAGGFGDVERAVKARADALDDVGRGRYAPGSADGAPRDLELAKWGGVGRGERAGARGRGRRWGGRKRVAEDAGGDGDGVGGKEWGDGEVVVYEGSFTSPAAEGLPEEVTRRAHFQLVTTAGLEEGKVPLRGAVVLFSMTGDMGYSTRRRWAEGLAREGFVSVLLLPACYGVRRPAYQRSHYVHTVAEFVTQSTASITEGASLLVWLHARYPRGTPLGVAGFSWGGAMASCAAAAVSSFSPHIACVSCMGSPSPEAVIQGVLGRVDVDWNSLRRPPEGHGGVGQGKRRQRPLAEVHAEVMDILRPSQFSTIVARNPQPCIGAARMLHARHDWFIPPAEAERLSHEMRGALAKSMGGRACDDGRYEVTPVGGGHATAFLGLSTFFVPTVVGAFDALPDPGGEGGRRPREGERELAQGQVQ